MKCQTYIFQLTSGQLDAAGWTQRLQAAQHRLICRHCRAFTRNDEQLSRVLQAYSASLRPEPDAQTPPQL